MPFEGRRHEQGLGDGHGDRESADAMGVSQGTLLRSYRLLDDLVFRVLLSTDILPNCLQVPYTSIDDYSHCKISSLNAWFSTSQARSRLLCTLLSETPLLLVQ